MCSYFILLVIIVFSFLSISFIIWLIISIWAKYNFSSKKSIYHSKNDKISTQWLNFINHWAIYSDFCIYTAKISRTIRKWWKIKMNTSTGEGGDAKLSPMVVDFFSSLLNPNRHKEIKFTATKSYRSCLNHTIWEDNRLTSWQ